MTSASVRTVHFPPSIRDGISGASSAESREDWLIALVFKLAPLFDLAGYGQPQVRVSCGWPSTRALANRRRLGECWPGPTVRDAKPQIFISPAIEDSHRVAGVLVHEMLHAVLPPEAGHGHQFRVGMRRLGLIGKPSSTEPGPELSRRLNAVLAELPPYPHTVLDKTTEKRQGTRLLKLFCPSNEFHPEDYIIRATRKAIAIGMPQCPCGRIFQSEESDV